MDEKEPQEKKKFKISDLYNNKRYYAIANLAFYGILIICLIIFVRGIPDPVENNNNNNSNGTVQSSVEGFSNIKNKNYNFKYTLVYDNKTVINTGKQSGNSITFTVDDKEYFYQDGLFFEKENDKFVLCDYEIKYFDYFNVDIIEKFLSENKKQDETYVISKEKISEVLNKETNIESMSITLTKSNGIITKINFEITEISPMSVRPVVLLEYSDFGLVEEFNIKNN